MVKFERKNQAIVLKKKWRKNDFKWGSCLLDKKNLYKFRSALMIMDNLKLFDLYILRISYIIEVLQKIFYIFAETKKYI